MSGIFVCPFCKEKAERIKELEAQLERYKWISLDKDNVPLFEGNVLIKTVTGSIYKAIAEIDGDGFIVWKDNDGYIYRRNYVTHFMVEIA